MPVICGWLRRAFFKACPPAACTIARPDLPAHLGTPVDLRSTSIRGRPWRALLVRLRRPTLQRSLRSLRQGGFALYVRLRHYRSSLLAVASNALTFVRGADRACCAPRKKQRSLTYAPRKWPLGLLYCINGFADQPMLACTSPRTPPGGALAGAPGSDTLPPPCRPRLLCAA